MKDNSIIEAVALMEHIRGSIHVNERVQLNRTELEEIKRLLSQTLNKIASHGDDFSQANFHILGTHDLLTEMLKDEDFDQTDTDTKCLIYDHISTATDELYLRAGRYYCKDNEFDYYLGLDALLQRIIKASVKAGFFFGKAV